MLWAGTPPISLLHESIDTHISPPHTCVMWSHSHSALIPVTGASGHLFCHCLKNTLSVSIFCMLYPFPIPVFQSLPMISVSYKSKCPSFKSQVASTPNSNPKSMMVNPIMLYVLLVDTSLSSFFYVCPNSRTLFSLVFLLVLKLNHVLITIASYIVLKSRSRYH